MTAGPDGLTIFQVDDKTGSFAQRFSPNGPIEVWLIGLPERVFEPGFTGRPSEKELPVLPIGFRTIDQGERAGAILCRAFERVAAIQRSAVPDPEGCVHRVRLERYARTMPLQAVCELCNAVLRSDIDVDEAKAAGYETLKEAIEAESRA